MICNVCQKNPATYDDYYGWLPCASCMEAQSKLTKPGSIPEFVGEDIKLQRQKFHKDIIQSNRKGELNKEYVDVYGADRARHEGYTEKEIKNAKYVYSGDESYYKK